MNNLGFIHRFEPGRSSRTLLLLHGTGGNENELIDLGRAIDPNAALLSPRGKVLENGAPRFFRRLAEGVFDEEDVVRRAQELSAFVRQASETYGIDRADLVAVGYSNGANIAAAIWLLGLTAFSSAVLLRPMVPLSSLSANPDLAEVRALLIAGRADTIAHPSIAQELTDLLRRYGAKIDLRMNLSGHELTSEDVKSAREWLA